MFFSGWHQPAQCRLLNLPMISYNRIRDRRSDIPLGPGQEWMLDSGAFTTLAKHGDYPDPPQVYAYAVLRWALCGRLLAAVTQDWMCEPFMLEKTGLDVAEHQRRTVDRYRMIRDICSREVYIMPVLQGYGADDYVRHVEMFGDDLESGAWCGVGSVCKRNGDPQSVFNVLFAISRVRPDLRLHGFGLKLTTLMTGCADMLHSADSMASSYAARMDGLSANDPRIAIEYAERVREHFAGRSMQTDWLACTDPGERA